MPTPVMDAVPAWLPLIAADPEFEGSRTDATDVLDEVQFAGHVIVDK